MKLTNEEKQYLTGLLELEITSCQMWITENQDNPDVDFQGFKDTDYDLNIINKILDKIFLDNNL